MYDVYEIRKEFPMLDNKKMQGHPLIFLDNASTTFKPYSVIEAIEQYNKNLTSNSHRGDYDLCYKVDLEVEECRKDIAKFINADAREVVFTSGDTMSLNLIAYGYALSYLKEGDEILLSESEHASNMLPWFKIAKLTKAIIKFIPLEEDGRLTVKNLNKVINKKTKIVSVAHIGNVLGYLTDIKSFSKIAHSYGALLVVDGAQSVPHIKVDFKNLDIDFLTFSAHKMCGPTGIGCLIGKYSLLKMTEPFLLGGGMNVDFDISYKYEPYLPPTKFEAGTLNLEGIFGFHKAILFLNNLGMENIEIHERILRKYAIEKLEKNPNVYIYNKYAEGSIITFNVKDVFPQDEATLLNSKGIACRSGLHCAKALRAFLKGPGTVRMSTYLYTTKEDIDALVDALKNGGDILDAYFND